MKSESYEFCKVSNGQTVCDEDPDSETTIVRDKVLNYSDAWTNSIGFGSSVVISDTNGILGLIGIMPKTTPAEQFLYFRPGSALLTWIGDNSEPFDSKS